MSSNNGFIFDEDGDDEDWIEIYNASNNPVSLSDYYLSDKIDALNLWAFPDTTIMGESYLVVWASGKNRSNSGGQLHTNFSIKASGEMVFLSSEQNIVAFSPEVSLLANQSFGLVPDGSETYVIINSPSPGESNNGSQIEVGLEFLQPGGIYDNTLELNITSSYPGAQIRFTTNGNDPDTTSQTWNNAVVLDQSFYSQDEIFSIPISPATSDDFYPEEVDRTIIIRAAAFDELGNKISNTVTQSYFIRELDQREYALPVISIAANHDDLFDFEIGIFVPGFHWDSTNPVWTGNYFNRGQDWERNINLEFYETGSNGINQMSGLRTHGGGSRQRTQKGMRLYARSQYGQSNFDYNIFHDRPHISYKRLVLKPMMSSWSHAGIEDHFACQLIQSVEVDRVAARPVEVFINGEYWGVYLLQERIDEHYLQVNYGDYDFDLIDNYSGDNVSSGDNQDYLELYQFIEQHDLQNAENFAHVAQKMDIESFIDYQLFQIFIGNYDWPANNMKCYKAKAENSKWRWIFFDGDGTLTIPEFDAINHAFSTNTEAWSTGPGATLFLRKLYENNVFRDHFNQRLESLLLGHFSSNQTSAVMDNIYSNLASNMPDHYARFYTPDSIQPWGQQLEPRYFFLENRACFLKRFLEELHGDEIMEEECPKEEPTPESLNIGLYPIPNNGNLTIEINSSENSFGRIIVLDVKGALVYQSDSFIINVGMSELDVNLKHLATGVYNVHVYIDHEVYIYRIVLD